MLPRDLLRRLTVSLHKYHSTLLPLAWDATPGLVEASYCLLTQVPFNIVTTCLRCYPGLVEASYCLLTQVPFNIVTTCLRCYPGLVEASYCLLTQVPFNIVTTCLRCYPGTCWGVLLSPYTSTIQHCYHLLEMLPRDLLRRLTVSLHKYHSTLLPLAWYATPGLVEASYCLLTQVPFNIVTTCLRCYPGSCWGVLLSPYTSTIQHCYHLLEMLPRDLLRRLTVSLHYTIQHCYHLLEMLPQDLLRRLTVSLHKYYSTLSPLAWDATPGLVEASYCLLIQVPFNTVTTCLRCYTGTCWGVLLSPYTSTTQHCYHLLEMLPRDLLRRLTGSLHKYHSTLLPLA